MKKSGKIVLSAIMLAAISSCNEHEENWTYGNDQNGQTHDTFVHSSSGCYFYYRYYNGGWYPIQKNNMINTNAASFQSSDISSPSFSPRTASGTIHSGGFGGTGEGGGEGGGE